MATESFYTESGTSPPSRKESDRKYRESHRAQRRAYDRKRQQLPEVKARRNETARIRRQNAAIAFHGMPGLGMSMQHLPRPKTLTDLIIQEAKRWSSFWGDNDKNDYICALTLKHAAEEIRENPFYPVEVPWEERDAYFNEHGITYPWYQSSHLSEFPKGSLSRKMGKLALRLSRQAEAPERAELAKKWLKRLDQRLASLKSREVQS